MTTATRPDTRLVGGPIILAFGAILLTGAFWLGMALLCYV